MPPSGPRARRPLFALVGREPASAPAAGGGREGESTNPARDLDWSILMARAQDGDCAAYRRLLEEITPYLRALAVRHRIDRADVEDAMQDILLTLHAIRHTYDPRRPFAPWLVAIANRRLVDRLRRQGWSQSHRGPPAAHETFPADQTKFDDEISDRRQLRAAIARLPFGQRQAVRLLKLEEMSLREAAAASGMSVAALKVAMHRALKNLRKRLARGGGEA